MSKILCERLAEYHGLSFTMLKLPSKRHPKFNVAVLYDKKLGKKAGLAYFGYASRHERTACDLLLSKYMRNVISYEGEGRIAPNYKKAQEFSSNMLRCRTIPELEISLAVRGF